MSFNKNNEEIARLLEKRARELEYQKRKEEIEKNTYVLTEEEQKETCVEIPEEIEFSDWVKYDTTETEEKLLKHACQIIREWNKTPLVNIKTKIN